MILLPFEPGDGHRYWVAFEPLDPRIGAEMGCPVSPYLFLFGFENTMSAYPFQRDTKVPYLAWSDYCEKMDRKRLEPGYWSTSRELITGIHVAAYLLGRKAIHAPYSPPDLGWCEDWKTHCQAQLQPLIVQIGRTEFAARSRARERVYLEKFDAASGASSDAPARQAPAIAHDVAAASTSVPARSGHAAATSEKQEAEDA